MNGNFKEKEKEEAWLRQDLSMINGLFEMIRGRPDNLQNVFATISCPQGRDFHMKWRSFPFS